MRVKKYFRGKEYTITSSEIRMLTWFKKKGIDWLEKNHRESFKKFKKLGLLK